MLAAVLCDASVSISLIACVNINTNGIKESVPEKMLVYDKSHTGAKTT